MWRKTSGEMHYLPVLQTLYKTGYRYIALADYAGICRSFGAFRQVKSAQLQVGFSGKSILNVNRLHYAMRLGGKETFSISPV